ncbi:hypothetical protein G5714_023067 [Onychostoma macrolepis]|uniref:Transposase domain-containing protein n=1 Tax=Onychostoma macrolepis TaxID=369639 RepID=A0A7J6BPZ5_9TELE|nr:hypothetical protein G5714_023067 [Onychostoma macrolepis]
MYPLQDISELDFIDFSLNIDGLPLFKSSKKTLWPVLCQLNLSPPSVFPLALCFGLSKPKNLDFLDDVVGDLCSIIDNGLETDSGLIRMRLRCVTCDAPAKALVKSIKLCSGYYGCDKCTQKGVWDGHRVIYPEINHLTLRTDQTFRDQSQEEHHLSSVLSPFCQLPINMIEQFPADYMHQCCLGVMRKMILMWLRGPLGIRLSSGHVKQVSLQLLKLKACIPNVFARKPRGLDEIDRWKATELRQFALYTGKIVLKGIIAEQLYEHFLVFSVALSILVCPRLAKQYNHNAEELLVYFIAQGRHLYGVCPQFDSYNKARDKVNQATMTSNLDFDQEEEKGRKIVTPARYLDSETDIDEPFAKRVKKKTATSATMTPQMPNMPSFTPSMDFFSARHNEDSPTLLTNLDVTSTRTMLQSSDQGPSITSTPNTTPNTQNDSCTPPYVRAIFMRLDKIELSLETIQSILTKNMSSDDPEIEELTTSLQTPAQLEEASDKLKDTAHKKKVVDYLSPLGGKSPGDSVRRIMRKIGTNALWANYSLKGRKGKINFQDLAIYPIIIRASDSRDEELGLRFADRILLRDCVAQVDCERLGPEAGALVEGFRCRQVGPDPAGLMGGGSGVPSGSGVLSAGDVVERSRDDLACCVDSVALQRGVPDGSAGNPDCSRVFRDKGPGVKITNTVTAIPQTCSNNSSDLENVANEGEGQLGVTTGARDQERRSASSQRGAGVKDQADGGVGDLITLSLDGKEAKEAESEQQLGPTPEWTDLDFTEVLSDVLEEKEEQATLEPAIGSTHQREGVHSGSEMEVSSELVPGTSRRRTWSDAGDHDNREICKHSKLENFVSQRMVGQDYKGEDYEDKEKEEGGQAVGGGIVWKRKKEGKK